MKPKNNRVWNAATIRVPKRAVAAREPVRRRPEETRSNVDERSSEWLALADTPPNRFSSENTLLPSLCFDFCCEGRMPGSNIAKRGRSCDSDTDDRSRGARLESPVVLAQAPSAPVSLARRFSSLRTGPLTTDAATSPVLWMPRVGLGTFRAKGAKCAEAVRRAVAWALALPPETDGGGDSAGAAPQPVRPRITIDTAAGYNNEAAVADGIARAGATRADVFLITKVPKEAMRDAASVTASVRASMRALRTDRLDVVLLHWPGTANGNTRSPVHAAARLVAWRALEAIVRDGITLDTDSSDAPAVAAGALPRVGRVSAIGVSNYSEAQLAALLGTAAIRPSLLQAECHPFLPETPLRALCAAHDIAFQAYTSLGRCAEPPRCVYGIREPDHPRLVVDATVVRVAAAARLTPAQVLLRWALQRGMSVVPKAADGAHFDENVAGIFSDATALDAAALRELDELTLSGGRPVVRYAYPPVKFPV